MPELPEVETVVRGLRDDVVGQTIIEAQVYWEREIANLPPDSFLQRIKGQRIIKLWRRAKYIVFTLTDAYMLVHLKMTGRLYVAAPGHKQSADKWVRVLFTMDDGMELRFSDSRKFGRVYLTSDLAEITAKLGPEPLEESFTLNVFKQRLSGRSGLIKPLLLNQEFIAGVGNIYADEALWRAGIDPRRKANTLKPEELGRLYAGIRGALLDGIRHEGASINWYRKPDGTRGEVQNHFAVYGRASEPCTQCGAVITKIWLAQRGTHFCPHCQK